jgi:hypothetical protein
MVYTLNTYGWSAEFIGKTLSVEQHSIINDLLDEKNVDDISEIRFDLDDHVDFDIWDGDILHITKALDNDTMLFQVLDEGEKVVLEFGIEDLVNLGDINEDIYNDHKFYDVFPSETSSVYFSVDEFKGGIFSYEFESDETPKIEHFNYLITSIDTPNGEWDIIDKIYHNGEELEILDYLDNTGKSSTIEIFHWEE